jgi:outer membrane protein assembly factor BamB
VALNKLPPGNELYSFDASATISAPMAQHGDIAYMACEDLRVYALDMDSGQISWRYVVGSPVIRRPRVLDEDVFVSTVGSGIYRLDRRTGQLLWRAESASRFIAANPKFVYAGNPYGRFMILDRQRGTTLSTYEGFRDFLVPLANDLTDRIYLASQDGHLLCLHDRDYPEPLLVRKETNKRAAREAAIGDVRPRAKPEPKKVPKKEAKPEQP